MWQGTCKAGERQRPMRSLPFSFAGMLIRAESIFELGV